MQDRPTAPELLDAVLSRETAFLTQNVLFLVVTFAILLGTIFPMISEWVTGDKISLNAPYFNRVAGPLMLALLLSVVWWFVTIYRAHRIEGRLRELAEQQHALDMARQLAAAQIQPHFLYNALAALQHWVQAKDDRAAPMLTALTGFLRTTLPLFNRERLALGDEAEAVRQYLAVMALRLGDRLRWSVEIDDDAARAAVPPGLLLTLVENAVEHGVTRSLAGAEVHVRAAVQGGRVALSVRDTGPGLAPAASVAGDGVGLANSRVRLAQAFAERATLQLQNAAGGGCLATIDMPLEPAAPR